MKYLFSIILIILTICSQALSQNMTATDEFQQFKEIREKMFRNPQVSPLLPEDFKEFTGLKYFAFDNKYRVKANFVKTTETKTFLMPTSTGGSRKYLKIGDLSFRLDGKEFVLGAYEYAFDQARAKEELGDLFVPFKDLTNGGETYSAGRYVYVRVPKDGEDAILDFNLAYNPNCAYGNGSYVCTLPPKENFLQVGIKAGEKKFDSLSGKTAH